MGKRFMHMAKAISLVCLMILAPAIALAQDAGQRYVLRPGDEITVQYRYTPEFDQTVKVQPDGFVALGIVGDMKLGGLTIRQARDMIIEKAKVRLKEPEVSLSLKEFERPFFVVAGEVVTPGKF